MITDRDSKSPWRKKNLYVWGAYVFVIVLMAGASALAHLVFGHGAASFGKEHLVSGVFTALVTILLLAMGRLYLKKRASAEDALRESEERYRDLFENASDLIQIITPEGIISYVNPAWRENLGYREDEISSLSFLNVVHPEDRARFAGFFQQLMSGKKINNVETRFITKKGRDVILVGNIDCNFRDGKPVMFRGIFHDITERKNAEVAQQSSIEELEFKTKELESAYLKIETDRNNLRSALDLFSEIIGEVCSTIW